MLFVGYIRIMCSGNGFRLCFLLISCRASILYGEEVQSDTSNECSFNQTDIMGFVRSGFVSEIRFRFQLHLKLTISLRRRFKMFVRIVCKKYLLFLVIVV
jgi:hypothetical protein